MLSGVLHEFRNAEYRFQAQVSWQLPEERNAKQRGIKCTLLLISPIDNKLIQFAGRGLLTTCNIATAVPYIVAESVPKKIGKMEYLEFLFQELLEVVVSCQICS
jgi:hypothetical protein